MAIYAELLFTTSNDEGDIMPYSLIARFKDMNQFRRINDDNLFEDLVPDIDNVLPFGWSLDSEIEIGVITDLDGDYDIDLSSS